MKKIKILDHSRKISDTHIQPKNDFFLKSEKNPTTNFTFDLITFRIGPYRNFFSKMKKSKFWIILEKFPTPIFSQKMTFFEKWETPLNNQPNFQKNQTSTENNAKHSLESDPNKRDRQTDRRTDGPTDGRTDPLIEMRGRI